jgi:hypothetical protein
VHDGLASDTALARHDLKGIAVTDDNHERHRGSKLAEEPLSTPGNPWTKEEYAAMDARFRGAMLNALERRPSSTCQCHAVGGDDHGPNAGARLLGK